MTYTAQPPYLYVPSSHASAEGPLYFRARHYANHDAAMLDVVKFSAEMYAPKPKTEKTKGASPLVKLPDGQGGQRRAAAKGDILQMLDRLIDTAPVDAHERGMLRATWMELRDGHVRDAQVHPVLAMEHRLKDVCHALVPDTLKGNPKTMAGLRDKYIGAHLQHMREVYDATVDEAKRGHRELTEDSTPNFIQLERKMRMALSMAQLDRDVGAAFKMYEMDDSDLFIRGRDARLCERTRDAIGQFESYMDKAHPKWRGKKLAVPEDWALKGEADTMTLGDMVGAMKTASDAAQLKPYAELLHHVVAKRAYYFKRDLAKAYDEDYRHIRGVVAQRNKTRNADVHGENPFEGHQELISAAYNAKWVMVARDVMKLMHRYERTLEDPAVIAAEPTNVIDSASLFGRTAEAAREKPKGRKA